MEYLSGSEISIADLSAAMELEELILVKESIDAYPNLKIWKNKVLDSNPAFGKACE